MRRVEIRALILSIAMVWIAGAPVMGQDASTGELTAEQKLEAQARELAASIDESWQEIKGLSRQLEESSHEDTQALRERGRGVLGEFLADLDALSINIVDREEAGLDAAADRERVAETMRVSVGYLETSAIEFLEKSDELRSRVDDASAEEGKKLKSEIEYAEEWYGTALSLLAEQTIAMERFGLGADEQKVFLTEHLERRAELVAGRVMLGSGEVDRISRLASVDPTNTEVAAELDAANRDLQGLIGRLDATSRMMEELGMDASDYEQLVFEVTGEITTDLLDRDVLGGLAKTWMRAAGDWLKLHGPGAVFKLLLFLGILVVFRVLSRLARRVVKRALSASTFNVSQLLERTTLSLAGNLVMIFGLLVALSQVGFEIAPLLAGLGVAGFIVGFALQDTLGNFASGVMILIYRPYDVGDLVEAAGNTGKVKDMNLVSTTILTIDNQTLVIPNSKIWGDVIKNVTAQTERRVDMVFGIGYSDDIEHAERVLAEILDAHDKVLDEPEPTVKLHNLGDSSVDFVVRPWVATDDYWDVYWDITREVKMRFDAEGISIPFPQRDVHLFEEGGGNGS